jgi:hypothetical protein
VQLDALIGVRRAAAWHDGCFDLPQAKGEVIMFRLTIREEDRSKPVGPVTAVEGEEQDTIRGLPVDDSIGALSREGRRLSRAAVLESLRLAPRIPRQHAELADRVCDTLLASYVRFARASREPHDAGEEMRAARVSVLDAVAALAPILRSRKVPREEAGRLFVLLEQLVRLAESAR